MTNRDPLHRCGWNWRRRANRNPTHTESSPRRRLKRSGVCCYHDHDHETRATGGRGLLQPAPVPAARLLPTAVAPDPSTGRHLDSRSADLASRGAWRGGEARAIGGTGGGGCVKLYWSNSSNDTSMKLRYLRYKSTHSLFESHSSDISNRL